MVTIRDIMRIVDSQSREIPRPSDNMWVGDNEYYYNEGFGPDQFAASALGHSNDYEILILQDKAPDTTVFLEVEGVAGQVALTQGRSVRYPVPQRGGPRRIRLVDFHATTPEEVSAYAPPAPPAPPAAPPMAQTPDWMDGQVALLALGAAFVTAGVAYYLVTREAA